MSHLVHHHEYAVPVRHELVTDVVVGEGFLEGVEGGDENLLHLRTLPRL
jgi:hypothetical protein